MDTRQYMQQVGRDARAASRLMAGASAAAKNDALNRIAGEIRSRRDALLEAAGRGDVIVSARTVDTHIAHLRKKLAEVQPDSADPIRTVRGVGYVLLDRASEDER